MLLGEDSLLHLKFNSFSLKSYEYMFVQYMAQFDIFKFEEIKRFNFIYFGYYYFTNDLTRHFASFFCEKVEGSQFLRLKPIPWRQYFASPANHMAEFLQNPEWSAGVSDSEGPSRRVLDMSLVRKEKEVFVGVYQSIKNKYFSGDQKVHFSFKPLFENETILEPFKYQEVFFSFYNFKFTFDHLARDEINEFLAKFDFIVGSLLNRILDLCKACNSRPSFRGRSHQNGGLCV